MNTHKLFGVIALALLCTMALVGAVAAIPVNVTRVEIDDHKIDPDQTNRLDIVRDQKVDFEVTLEATQDIQDVEVQVFVSGFEHNDQMALSAHVGPFDLDAGITYRKHLSIAFPDLVDEDNYKVRIVLTDRDGQETIENYNVKLDVERHDLKIVDASFTPGRTVQAGQALLSIVRVKNFGERDEDNVKVTVSVPELGISASDYIDEIENEDEEDTEELYLRVPKCAKPDTYDTIVTVQYNDGFSKTGAQGTIEVTENPACAEKEQVDIQLPPAQPANDTVEAVPRTSGVRAALEIILLVLVGLLVVIGLIIGFTKMGSAE